jgi:hypothetical protein
LEGGDTFAEKGLRGEVNGELLETESSLWLWDVTNITSMVMMVMVAMMLVVMWLWWW